MKLIDTIETYCKDNDIKFILGTRDYQNLQLDMQSYKNGQLILLLDVNYNVNVYAGQVTAYAYNVTMALGIKFDEDGAEANLQELYIQKYHKRLRYLTEKMNQIIGEIACIGDFVVDSFNARYDINQLDLNFDCVAGSGVIRETI